MNKLVLLVIPMMVGGTFFFSDEAEEKTTVVVEQKLKPVVFSNEIETKTVEFNDGKKIHGCHVTAAKCLDLKLCPRQPVRNVIKLPFRLLQIVFKPKCR